MEFIPNRRGIHEGPLPPLATAAGSHCVVLAHGQYTQMCNDARGFCAVGAHSCVDWSPEMEVACITAMHTDGHFHQNQTIVFLITEMET